MNWLLCRKFTWNVRSYFLWNFGKHNESSKRMPSYSDNDYFPTKCLPPEIWFQCGNPEILLSSFTPLNFKLDADFFRCWFLKKSVLKNPLVPLFWSSSNMINIARSCMCSKNIKQIVYIIIYIILKTVFTRSRYSKCLKISCIQVTDKISYANSASGSTLYSLH